MVCVLALYSEVRGSGLFPSGCFISNCTPVFCCGSEKKKKSQKKSRLQKSLEHCSRHYPPGARKSRHPSSAYAISFHSQQNVLRTEIVFLSTTRWILGCSDFFGSYCTLMRRAHRQYPSLCSPASSCFTLIPRMNKYIGLLYY